MALTLIEGFDHESSTALLDLKGWAFQTQTIGGLSWTPSVAPGRINGNAFYATAPSAQIPTFQMAKVLPAAQTTIVTGLGFQISTDVAIGGVHYAPLFQWLTHAGTVVLEMGVTGARELALLDGSAATIATSAPNLINAGAWNFVECKAVVNAGSSTVELHLDGATVITSTATNLGSTGIQIIQAYSIANNGFPGGSDVAIGYDDVYCLNTSGGINTTFLGDCHVETIFPNADGTHLDFTPSSGMTHYNLVNEHTSPPFPDEDVTYVYSETVNAEDSYAYDDLTITSGTVFGLQTNLWARKVDAVLRTVAPLIRISGTDYIGSDVTLTTSYQDGTQIYDASPATSVHFTVAEVNAAQFGIKITT